MDLAPLFEQSQAFLEVNNQPYRRYFILEDNALTERFAILLGQRGIGKTTLLTQHLLDFAKGDRLSTKILYLQADHFLLEGMSLYEIARDFQLMGGECIAFDEIHKYENWSQELKSIYDSFPKLKMLSSGSSALEIHKGSHDLSRRALVHHILGMSFREFLELKLGVQLQAYPLESLLNDHGTIVQNIFNDLSEKSETVIPLFHDYLLFGYYPYYETLQNIHKFQITLEQNIHTTLESDLTAIYPKLNSHSVKKVKQLLIFISENAPYTPSWTTLKKFLDIGDERTLKNYLKLLEDAGLVIALYKSSTQLSRFDNPAKLYLQNTNLMHAITRKSMNIGTAREVFFYSMLSKEHELSSPLNGDFLIDDAFIFEVGGRKKSFDQIKNHQTAYLACDNIETGFQNKIPLWLFGFLY